MSMEIIIIYPAAWANRIGPMADEEVEGMKDNEIVKDLLIVEGYTSVDELDQLQKTSLMIQFNLITGLQRHEGKMQADSARHTVVNEIKNNFPMDIPDAE